MKKILVINGHPVEDSFSKALADSYIEGAESKGYKVEIIQVRKMDFNPNLMFGYKKRMKMESDVAQAISKIKESDHIVWIFPMWWYSMPAMLKGFIDRTFLPDVAFRSRPGKLPEKLLRGRSSRIIITSDTPRWFDRIYMKSPAINQLRKGTLKFSGINPVKVTYIAPIKNSRDSFRQKWLRKVEILGSRSA